MASVIQVRCINVNLWRLLLKEHNRLRSVTLVRLGSDLEPNLIGGLRSASY